MQQFRAGIIGLGSVSPMHINSLKAIGVEIAAVCDIRADVAAAKAAELSCAAFSDYREMLASDNFNVLHICLPHYLHAEVSIAALERGCHVLCEKPMATTISDAEKMIAAAEKSRATLSIVYQNRFNPGTELIKEALKSGELGAVRGGWLRVTWYRDDTYYADSDWRGSLTRAGGGVAINQSIHTFDLMNYFLGNPTMVSAAIANRAHPSVEVEDMAEGVITYGDVPISFFVNTYHPYDAPAALEIVCEHGRATLTGEDAVIIMNDGRKKTAGADIEAQQRFGMKSYWGVSHVKYIQAAYDAIASGCQPHPSGGDGLVIQRLIDTVYKSAMVGQTIFFA